MLTSPQPAVDDKDGQLDDPGEKKEPKASGKDAWATGSQAERKMEYASALYGLTESR